MRSDLSTARLILRTLVRDAGIALIVCVLLEVTLQLAAPGYRRHLFDSMFTGGFPIQRGAEGFRGPVPAKEKAAGEWRVMCLGDSVTMGTGVPAAATFAHALGAFVTPSSGGPLTTINGGVEGWGLKELTVALERDWGEYRPDVVIVAVCGNMVSRSWIDRDVPLADIDPGAPIGREAAGLRRKLVQVKRTVKKLCLPSFLTLNTERLLYALGVLNHRVTPAAPFGALLAHGWRQLDLDPARPDEAWSCFGTDLGRVAQAARARGARVVITAIPSRFTLTTGLLDNEKQVPRNRLTMDPCDRVREVCAAQGLTYIDVRAALRVERQEHPGEDLYIQFDYTHLDEQGHRAAAKALAPAAGP